MSEDTVRARTGWTSVLALGGMVALAACGGTPAAGPSPVAVPPAGMAAAPASVLDGATGQPVAATVEQLGASVRVTAPGYLPREQPAAGTIFLWPAPDPAYVRALVYEVDGTMYPLERWEAGRAFKHCIGAGVVDRDLVEFVADTMASAAGIPRTSSGPCNVEWIVDEEEAARVSAGYSRSVAQYGTAVRTFNGRLIIGARLVFKDVGSMYAAAAHEAGHALGLRHSSKTADLMYPNARGLRQFSTDEIATLVMMYRRAPGNVWPDTEPAR